MNVRVFKEYQKYSDKPLLCGTEPMHGPLACTLDKDDDVVLVCFLCGYKLRPGLAMYKMIVDSLPRLKKD